MSWKVEPLEPRLLLAADAVGNNSLVNDLIIRTQSISDSSSAVVATSSNTIVVFEGKGPVDDQGVFAEIFNADGATTTASFRVNSTIRADQYAPAIAADSLGNFVVTWAGRGEGDKYGIYFQRFDSLGTPLGSETLVNTTTGGKQEEPAIAMDRDGSFVITWSGVGSGDFSGIFLQQFDSSGNAVGDETLVNTTTDDHQTSPSVAYDTDGSFAVGWQSRHQDGSDWGVFGQWFSSAGATLGSEFQINVTTTDSQSAPSLASDPTGGVVVVWQSREQDGDSWGIVAREFDNNGSSASLEVELNEDTAGHQQDPSIAVADDGQWLASWTSGVEDGSGWEVVAKSVEADGTQQTSEIVNTETSGANSGHQETPAVTIVDDRAVVAWSGNGQTDHHGVYTQAYEIDADIDEEQQSPDIAPISDQEVEAETQIEIIVTATDPNVNDTLTFFLDPDDAPDGATLEQIDNNTARILWTPTESEVGNDILFRVLVTDDGEPVLSDSEDFLVTVLNSTEVESTSTAALDEALADFA